MKLGLFHFELLYDVLMEMHFLYDEEEMAATVLARLSPALSAEAGTIFRAEKDGHLTPLASFGVDVKNLRKLTFKKGSGVVGWVSEYMQPVKVDRPDSDPRFMGVVDSHSGFKTRSIIAAPIIVRNELVGIIEFLNRKGGPFVVQDLELVSMIGREVGIAMVNCRVIKERDDLLAFQEAVMGSLSAGLLVVDAGFKVTQANARAAVLLGLSDHEALLGQAVSQALFAGPELVAALQETFASSQGKPRQEAMATIQGRPRRIGYSTVPVHAKGGEKLGVALLFQDITDFRPA